jgi:hypothetical protein
VSSRMWQVALGFSRVLVVVVKLGYVWCKFYMLWGPFEFLVMISSSSWRQSLWCICLTWRNFPFRDGSLVRILMGTTAPFTSGMWNPSCTGTNGVMWRDGWWVAWALVRWLGPRGNFSFSYLLSIGESVSLMQWRS